MAYPGQPVRIPINVTAGTVPVPAAVDYTVTLLTSVEAPILPMLNGSLVRTLAWDPVHGGNAAITLPINWTEVIALSSSNSHDRAALPDMTSVSALESQLPSWACS